MQKPVWFDTHMQLPDPWASRVRGGFPHFLLKDICESRGDWSDRPPGQALMLRDTNDAFLGFGVLDPDNKFLRVWPAIAGDKRVSLPTPAPAPKADEDWGDHDETPDESPDETPDDEDELPDLTDPLDPAVLAQLQAESQAVAEAQEVSEPVVSSNDDENVGPDREFFRRRLAAAKHLRDGFRLIGPDRAFRLINGEGDGLSGFAVDAYAGNVIITVYSQAFLPWAKILGEALLDVLPVVSIGARVRPPGDVAVGRVPLDMIFGEPPPRELLVRENDAHFEVHLMGGVNTGLFCDLRDARRDLMPWFKGRRVLNLFSYTGSFSVLAAQHQAESVTSVDFVKGNLAWTRSNFVHNKLNLQNPAFKFVRADVFDFLKEARRNDRQRYDVVIVDPPTQTMVPGRRWFLKTDYHRLIGHAVRVLAPGGLLVVAASCGQLKPDQFEQHLRTAAIERQCRFTQLHSLGLPPDFPTQMIYPQGRYLNCQFLAVE